MRFDLIDRVLEQHDARLVAIKAVTAAEEYLADHFPSFPVLPGVMMLETLVQAARRLLSETGRTDAATPMILAEARNVRYGNMVRPGESLKVEVELVKQDDGAFEFKGTGWVGEQGAVQARFRLAPMPE